MSRPKPKIIITNSSCNYPYEVQILDTEQYVYVVTYKDKPISLRYVHQLLDKTRYPKTCFTTKGTGLNVVKKLNEKFDGNLFDLKKIKL